MLLVLYKIFYDTESVYKIFVHFPHFLLLPSLLETETIPKLLVVCLCWHLRGLCVGNGAKQGERRLTWNKPQTLHGTSPGKPAMSKCEITPLIGVIYIHIYNYIYILTCSYPCIRPFIGVITPFITSRGPSCRKFRRGFLGAMDCSRWLKCSTISIILLVDKHHAADDLPRRKLTYPLKIHGWKMKFPFDMICF